MNTPEVTIMHNAVIHTMDDRNPRADAMAFADGRFLMIGDEEEILDAYPGAQRLNASGYTIVPGLIDAHAHVLMLGESLMEANLTTAKSAEEVVRILENHAAQHPHDEWIIGRGWDESRWSDGGTPVKEILDTAFPDQPVCLIRIDHHALWVNSTALRLVDHLSGVDDPPGGRIVRDAKGEATGVLIDSAMRFIGDLMPSPTPQKEDVIVQRALQEMNRHGLTGVHDATISDNHLKIFRRAMDAGTFSIRLNGMIDGPGPLFDSVCENGPVLEDRLVVRTLKLFADGALGSRGAALLADYADDPGNRGLFIYDETTFDKLVGRAVDAGLQVATHAIGDAGVRFVLDSYERVIGSSNGRHRIEHVQVIDPADVARFRDLNLIASMQPIHFAEDRTWAPDRLGDDRVEWAYAWKKMQKAGVRLAFGSDFPIAPASPLEGFFAAVDVPENRAISRNTVLRAYTIDAAYAAFMEDEVGSIFPGKRADFVIMDTDILSAPLEVIPDTKVLSVWMDGELVASG